MNSYKSLTNYLNYFYTYTIVYIANVVDLN